MYFVATDTTTTEKWSLQIITLFVKRKKHFLSSVLMEKRKMLMNSNKISTNLNYYTIVRKRRKEMRVSVERIRVIEPIA